MDIGPISSSPSYSPPNVADKAVAAPDAASMSRGSAAPVEPTAAVQQPQVIPTLEQLNSAVKSINAAMRELAQGLEFSIDKDTRRVVVKVIDQQTKEVIRQIPSEEALNIAKALDQVSGLLIRQKA